MDPSAPDTYRSFHEIVADNARRWPDRVYVHCIDQDKSLTYGQLYGLSNRIARYLKESGLGANDRVLLLAENSVETLAVFVSVGFAPCLRIRHFVGLSMTSSVINQVIVENLPDRSDDPSSGLR